jgi:hypothetical protein
MAKTTPTTVKPEPWEVNICCKQKREEPEEGKKPWTRCMCQQLCVAIKKMDEARSSPNFGPKPGARKTSDYTKYKRRYIKAFMKNVNDGKNVDNEFIHPCAACEYKKMLKGTNPTTGGHNAPFNAGHTHEAAWGGDLTDMSKFKMMDKRVNQTISFEAYPGKDHPIKAKDSCNCPDGPEPSDPGGCSGPEKEDPGDPYIDIGGEG